MVKMVDFIYATIYFNLKNCMHRLSFPSLFYLLIFFCVVFVGYHEFRQFPDYWQIRFGIPSIVFYLIAGFSLLGLRVLTYRKKFTIEKYTFDNVFGF